MMEAYLPKLGMAIHASILRPGYGFFLVNSPETWTYVDG